MGIKNQNKNQRKYYWSHKAQCNLASKKYYLRNRTKLKAKMKINCKNYYIKNKLQIDKKNSDYRKKRKLEIYEILGTRCVKCGFSDIRALQIDHINGGGSRERKLIGDNTVRYHKFIMKNRDKYQILCANCNWIKRAENNENRRSK